MRSLWLASAAIVISTGAAMAQTMSASPAPTGAPNAAQSTPATQASPGSMSPASAGQIGPAATSLDNTVGSTGTPAPTGAPGAASVTAPGASPGNMAPAGSTSASMAPPSVAPAGSAATTMPAPDANVAAMPPKHHMHMMGMSHSMMMMPADADAATYLHIASMAIKHGNKPMADEALSRAETRVLTRSVPQSSAIPTDDSPAVDAIEHARAAVASGNMSQAAMDTTQAMHADGG